MSTITRIWDENIIRKAIENLDRKTGLRGASIRIDIGGKGQTLGCYRRGDERMFKFKISFFNDNNTEEAEVIDIIRHEYAHYYVDEAKLDKYIGHSRRESSHGRDWKWACKMVGAIPRRCHDSTDFKNVIWTEERARAAYNADDIVECDILSFVNKWKQVPVDKEEGERMLALIQMNHPNSFFEVGDKVFHLKYGYGTVVETVPFKYWSQKVRVRFFWATDSVYTARDISKVIDGEVFPFDPSKKEEIQNNVERRQLTLEDLYPSMFS